MYRVIIVEDDNGIAEGICNCLAGWGMEARKITDFRRVTEEIEEYKPHLDYGEDAFFGKGGFWQKQLHIYNYPLYYIDYCLAQTCALQYKVKMDADFQSAWESYLKLCKLSASDFYTNMLKEVGLNSPFEDGCIKNIVENLEKYVK